MPIFDKHPAINNPTENFTLWRYMDIPSFLSLLTTNSLTFVRADLFEDKFEGKLPRPTVRLIDNQRDAELSTGAKEAQKRKFSEILDEESCKEVYLNCWCMANHEMVHMWKIYSKANGLAIETTYERLKESIETEETVYPTVINYHDFEKDFIDWKSNFLTAFTIKRKEYQSENEFRLIISSPYSIEKEAKSKKKDTNKSLYSIQEKIYKNTLTIKCKVNINKLITRIHISPYAPNWYQEIIINISSKYGLKNIEFKKSPL